MYLYTSLCISYHICISYIYNNLYICIISLFIYYLLFLYLLLHYLCFANLVYQWHYTLILLLIFGSHIAYKHNGSSICTFVLNFICISLIHDNIIIVILISMGKTYDPRAFIFMRPHMNEISYHCLLDKVLIFQLLNLVLKHIYFNWLFWHPRLFI